MSRKCPECHEAGNRAHLPGCSHGPTPDERADFIRANAVELVRALEERIRRQALRLSQVESANRHLQRENAALRRQIEGHCARIAAQAELLSKRAEAGGASDGRADEDGPGHRDGLGRGPGAARSADRPAGPPALDDDLRCAASS